MKFSGKPSDDEVERLEVGDSEPELYFRFIVFIRTPSLVYVMSTSISSVLAFLHSDREVLEGVSQICSNSHIAPPKSYPFSL